jgi:hypothetical protein
MWLKAEINSPAADHRLFRSIIGLVRSSASGCDERRAAVRARNLENALYRSSQTSSMRQPLYWLLTMMVSPLSCGCMQVAARGW